MLQCSIDVNVSNRNAECVVYLLFFHFYWINGCCSKWTGKRVEICTLDGWMDEWTEIARARNANTARYANANGINVTAWN